MGRVCQDKDGNSVDKECTCTAPGEGARTGVAVLLRRSADCTAPWTEGAQIEVCARVSVVNHFGQKHCMHIVVW